MPGLYGPLSSAACGKKVVLGHDWLTGMRGGERVLEHLCNAFPASDIVTLLHGKGLVSGAISSRKIVASFLQRIPAIEKHYRKFLPLMGLAAQKTPVPECDLFLTTSSCAAHAFEPCGSAKMLCYCFTPMRYAWLFPREYLGSLKSFILSPYLAHLRKWDFDHSHRVDRYVAISRHVQKRIKDFYGRESDVVYPPVDTEKYTPPPDMGKSDEGYDFILSALTPYKKIDLAVKAYNKTGKKLKIAGQGSEMAKLRKIANGNIEFLGWRSDRDIVELYRGCRLFIFPGEEDFGITPLEAMACGKPVVAYGKGGVTETVIDGETGILFAEQTPESMIDALEKAGKTNWDRAAIRHRAEEFSPESFIAGMAKSVAAVLAGPRL